MKYNEVPWYKQVTFSFDGSPSPITESLAQRNADLALYFWPAAIVVGVISLVIIVGWVMAHATTYKFGP